MKKLTSCIIAVSFFFSLADVSTATEKSFVKVKLDESFKNSPLATKEALFIKEAENKVVPEFLTQEEINNLTRSQMQGTQPESGLGIVATELANQKRDTYCSATPTVYNLSSEYINKFYGMLDVYQQFSTGGVYKYTGTKSLYDTYIPPTVNYGYSFDRHSVVNYGLGQYWDFYGTYEVTGSTATPLTNVRWNCL